MVSQDELAKPKGTSLLLEILWERGAAHEQEYIDHLESTGYQVVRIEGFDVDDAHVDLTIEAMRDGAEVIVQGALANETWGGRADILRRIPTNSALGAWSYDVIDTKLARHTKAGTILQLCLYSDLVAEIQQHPPQNMSVVTPWSDYAPQTFKTADFGAYYRLVKASLESSISHESNGGTYPEPCDFCEICHWRMRCEAERRKDDHLCLVADIKKLHTNELRARGISTTGELADLALPLPWKPERGAVKTYERIRDQARVQVEGRVKGEPFYETLEVEPGHGLARLPTPSPGDIFFDLEGDAFVGDGGIEYLFGYVTCDDKTLPYNGEWAFTRETEKQAFQRFVDFAVERRQQFPDYHIYHYASYEPTALKHLMGRYATREEAVDWMLRAGLLVDLFAVVKRGVRASVEGYSLKNLEVFYGYQRKTDLRLANYAINQVRACLELSDPASIREESKSIVETYNRDDCVSTYQLRNWLEEIRASLIGQGTSIDRPIPRSGDASENVGERQERVDWLTARLVENMPVDEESRTSAQQVNWTLASVLDWHWREKKADSWEYFHFKDLSSEELYDERRGVAGLEFVGEFNDDKKRPICRFRFPTQEIDFERDKELCAVGGDTIGNLVSISLKDRTIDIKMRQHAARPDAIFARRRGPKTTILANSLFDCGENFTDHQPSGSSAYNVAWDLLSKAPPNVENGNLRKATETALDAAIRLATSLQSGVLPIQGPPGAGKTFTGARMICELVANGAKVGITANSHKVIRNLLDETLNAAKKRELGISCVEKVSNGRGDDGQIKIVEKNDLVFNALKSTCQVAGGTAWLWARPEACRSVDVLFVDEAAQMSLANVLAISRAAPSLVLLGDPQQLDQPMKGSHPDGADVSALAHLLGDRQTIDPKHGIFLEETWRLHPDLCAFTSELFYEGNLRSRPGLENQTILSDGPIQGSGLRFLPVPHDGNRNASSEEAAKVASLVESLVCGKSAWVDEKKEEHPITLEDILIIAPYNAQVIELQHHLPGARVGTVDKFQGQEAPISVYSLATSTPADAPHGMEFLYSLNRLNVATSRARAVSIVVGSPRLFEPDCRTPRQMQLANAFCRYREMADIVAL